MAKVARATRMPAQDLAIDYGRPAHTRAKCNQDDVGNAFGRAAPYFGQQGGLGIIENRDRRGKLEPTLPIQIFQTGQTIGQGRDA
jgi:hypothetical protein